MLRDSRVSLMTVLGYWW